MERQEIKPQEYRMTVCPVCNGRGRIRSLDDVRVCKNCERFGFIREEGRSNDQGAKSRL